MKKISRRILLASGFRLAGAATAASALPWKGAAARDTAAAPSPPDDLPEAQGSKKLKVVFVGAHTDDWTICAGTMARYTRQGHEARFISFTPGDSVSMADEAHMSVADMAAARREQAIKGAGILGAKIVFLDQQDLRMHVDPESYQQCNKILLAEKPDVVFTIWPLEFHPDHRAAGNLAYNTWLQSGMKFAFYFCETPGGTEMQPQQFVPNRWVDVGSVMNLKRGSVLANTFIKDWWPDCELNSKFRGQEYGCEYAEAFVRVHTVASMPARNLYPNWWYYGGLRLARD
jgi:LmbE family N-acetylglucosaminyl deacetylase